MSHWLLPTRNKPPPPGAARRLRRAYAAALGWQLQWQDDSLSKSEEEVMGHFTQRSIFPF